MTYIDALSELEDIDETAPWCDLVFDVIEHDIFEQNADSGTVAWIKGRALANLKGEVIGFGFEIPLNTWHASRNQKPGQPRFHWSQINLANIGKATDKLVSSYAMWFHQQEMLRPAASRFPCSAVALEDGPPDPLRRKANFKLFFEVINDGDAAPEILTEENSPYAELFFNVDLQARRAWLREKDLEYRLPLLRFLTGELSPVPSTPLRRVDS
jgi:hypothetical protein